MKSWTLKHLNLSLLKTVRFCGLWWIISAIDIAVKLTIELVLRPLWLSLCSHHTLLNHLRSCNCHFLATVTFAGKRVTSKLLLWMFHHKVFLRILSVNVRMDHFTWKNVPQIQKLVLILTKHVGAPVHQYLPLCCFYFSAIFFFEELLNSALVSMFSFFHRVKSEHSVEKCVKLACTPVATGSSLKWSTLFGFWGKGFEAFLPVKP